MITPDLEVEKRYWGLGSSREVIVAGIDEVGRGSIAGPVVTGCVILKPDFDLKKIRDSKLLSQKQREEMNNYIKSEAPIVTIGIASPKEIDSLGITEAVKLAMVRAYNKAVSITPIDITLVDGMFSDLPFRFAYFIKGDQRIGSIAAASIIAKVYRDKFMSILHEIHPEYGWNKNKGYGTFDHYTAIKNFGISKHHRHSFNLDWSKRKW